MQYEPHFYEMNEIMKPLQISPVQKWIYNRTGWENH